ncbi:hypothetical protein HID58_064613 [Brassica napus]|uniref:FAD-binding PCMH-type domain-containing protein n=1 Tax=Brassica napus TaxID=3708 RepID=A0ABQ7ZAG9_BRANA|nr:hypothetical protein HID58_064613 [Brassica napus]
MKEEKEMKLVCLISFFFFISTSLAAVSPPNPTLYQNFLQCFSNQTQSPPNSLSDVVLPQTAPAFTPTLRAYIRNARFNTSTTSKPAIVIAARSEPHVQAAVLCTKSLNIQLKTRSGGHDYEGVSYTSNVPFFVLDMSNLRNITVVGESAWVGAGATLGEKNLDENAVDMVHKWQFVAPKTDPSLFMRLLLQPVTRNKAQTVRASVVALFLGKSSDVLSLLTRDFPELGLKQENCTELTWIQSVLWWANNDNTTQVKPEILLDRNPDSASYGKRKSDYVEKEITKEGEAEVYGRKYFGENFDRLVKVKTAVDPQNFFRDEQSVPTLPGKA